MRVGGSLFCSSQKEVEQEELEPGKAVYYTWAESTGSRELCWKCGTYSGKLKSEEVLCDPRDTSESYQTHWYLAFWCLLKDFVIMFIHIFFYVWTLKDFR